tara:strand:- start:1068 stop:1349 length:282 start_codon:yes stop_codon:yes gene_type:complete
LETVYQKYKPAHELLIEYYTYYDLRIIIRDEWKEEDEKYERQCIKLYQEYEEAAAREQQREANSKSARIAKKLEQMRLTNDLIEKIKYRNEKR